MLSSPMPAPTFEEALVQSQKIVLVEYLDYENFYEKIDYFSPPLANYRIIEVLKGSAAEGKIQVWYDFDDGSACIAPEGFTFKESAMPQKASRWILFLKDKNLETDRWNTYRGNFGRWPATEENLENIKAQIEKR